MAPLLISLLFLLTHRGSICFHPYQIQNDIHSANGTPFYILDIFLGGSLLIRSSIIFSGCVDMLHCFFIWLGFPQLKHLALAAFCTLKVSNVANFALWDIDPMSLHAFKYSIREPVSRIGLSTDRQSSLACSKASCFKIIFCKVTSLKDFSIVSFNFPIN